MEQRRRAGAGADPKANGLGAAVARLRRELATHPAELSDRAVAEDELAVLAAMARTGDVEQPRLHRCLLVVAGALGSVSALAPALREVREAVDLCGRPTGPPWSRD
ncbi:DUF5955 family protein [Streptomyces varsoviensis]|uniref:Uncharacterized protein n=1 Tax=Streptomyces varsoviensis TaxID=67373 RepID=A0ABR5IX05_9ACTN|nr:DUF5955 family protein [Streptomyces varsoviensis]KOG85689.1 hypothetical protein ADK38_35275 [Streptomyces varsoviensis]